MYSGHHWVSWQPLVFDAPVAAAELDWPKINGRMEGVTAFSALGCPLCPNMSELKQINTR
jgi:hypothetical protein